jgi:hypothetical protein
MRGRFGGKHQHMGQRFATEAKQWLTVGAFTDNLNTRVSGKYSSQTNAGDLVRGGEHHSQCLMHGQSFSQRGLSCAHTPIVPGQFKLGDALTAFQQLSVVKVGTTFPRKMIG